MAHTLTAIIPKIITRAQRVLRERCIMPQTVNMDYKSEARKFGDTIDIEVPSAVTTAAVVPAAVPTVGSDRTPTTVQIALDQWKKNDPIFLSDQDILEIDRRANFLPPTMAEAVRALANDVNQHIWSWYYKTGLYVLTGTKTFNDVTTATDARKFLNIGVAPKSDRWGVLDFTSEANMLALAEFSDFDKVGDKGPKFEGEIGRKFGINWVSDDHVPTLDPEDYTATTFTVNGGHSAGATTVAASVTVADQDLVKGDIITIAGDPLPYSIQADVTVTTGGGGNLTISPALRTDILTAAAITMDLEAQTGNDLYQCLVFHRDAIAFANRPLVTSSVDGELGNKMMTLTDDVSGLTMRLEVSRQYKQTAWEFDILWGSNLIRPDNVVRVIGY
jgi:hypothetical protein